MLLICNEPSSLTFSREKPPGDFLRACGNRVYFGAKVCLWSGRRWNLTTDEVKAEQYASSNEQVTESMYMTGKNEFMYSLPS